MRLKEVFVNLVCITEGESRHRHKDDRGTKGRVKAWVDKKINH